MDASTLSVALKAARSEAAAVAARVAESIAERVARSIVPEKGDKGEDAVVDYGLLRRQLDEMCRLRARAEMDEVSAVMDKEWV